MVVARLMSNRLPADVRRQLDLLPGERPLAFAVAATGDWCIGTERALHTVRSGATGPDGDGGHATRLPWERIERADWHRDTRRLAVVEVAEPNEPERRHEMVLTDATRLLALLRERVTKSVVVNVYAPVSGRRGLNVVGRRSPAGDGTVSWSFVLAAGLDPADPIVQAVAEQALASARAELDGLEGV